MIIGNNALNEYKYIYPHDGPMCDLLWSDPEDINLYNIIARFLMMVLCLTYSDILRI